MKNIITMIANIIGFKFRKVKHTENSKNSLPTLLKTEPVKTAAQIEYELISMGKDALNLMFEKQLALNEYRFDFSGCEPIKFLPNNDRVQTDYYTKTVKMQYVKNVTARCEQCAHRENRFKTHYGLIVSTTCLACIEGSEFKQKETLE